MSAEASSSHPLVEDGASPSTLLSPHHRDPKLDNLMDPGWLRAPTRTKNSIKISTHPEKAITLSDNSPRLSRETDDLESTYQARDLGEDDEDLHELFTYFDPDQPGPSILGVGRGKDIGRYREVMGDHPIEEEGEDEISLDGDSSKAEDRGEASDREGDDVQDDVISVSPIRYALELPSPPNNPYIPDVFKHEEDLEFAENFTEKEKVGLRKASGVVSCAGLVSEISSEYIMWMIEYYNLNGRWFRPRSFMRMHFFEAISLPTPRMVLTPQLVELGFGSPMHPFLSQIINHYGIAPIQLSPNSYRLAIGLFMMYLNRGYEPPTMTEISYFLDIRRNGNDLGFYYLAFWPKHNTKGFSKGNPSNMKIWKNEFFYLYDVPRVTTQFNLDPNKPNQTDLQGEALKRADDISDRPNVEKDLDTLVTPDTLRARGFYNDGFGQIAFQKFKRNLSKKALKRRTRGLRGKGKMSEIPFGENPFSEAVASAMPPPVSQSRPTASIVAHQAVPSSDRVRDKQNKKRNANVINLETGRGDVSKKGKHVAESSPSSVATLFGDLAKDNFSEEEVKVWNSRGRSESSSCLKQSLGESFLHGLSLVNVLEGDIENLGKSLKHAKESVSYYKGQLNEAEKKLFSLGETHKSEVKALQENLDETKELAKAEGEAHVKEMEKLQAELELSKADKLKYQSEAYSIGFLDYLRNFLAADPEYDWSAYFSPSTPGYMLKFKVDNANLIEKAKLKEKIQGELIMLVS